MLKVFGYGALSLAFSWFALFFLVLAPLPSETPAWLFASIVLACLVSVFGAAGSAIFALNALEQSND